MSSTNNQQITLQEAVRLTTSFQASKGAGFPICETFDLDNINTLLSVSGCVSLRIYLGQQADGTVVTILVAADIDGNDILPSAERTDVVILEDGYRCPQFCPTGSPLIA